MRHENQSGFFLIEMMVIATIIVIALLGVLDQAASAIRGNRIADQQAAATALAQSKIEDLARLLFDDVSNGSDATTLNADGTAGGIYTRSWSMTAQTVNGVSAKQLAVTVNWPQMTGTASAVLTTLIANIPDYSPGFPGVVTYSWRRQ